LLEEEKPTEDDVVYHTFIDSINEISLRIAKIHPNMSSEAGYAINSLESPSFLVNFVSSNIELDLKEKQKLLEENDQKERAMLALEHINTAL
ncbi:LON peptidase substrate-binding domain-containing protein, partial [Ornithobacterium rhinotracheale]